MRKLFSGFLIVLASAGCSPAPDTASGQIEPAIKASAEEQPTLYESGTEFRLTGYFQLSDEMSWSPITYEVDGQQEVIILCDLWQRTRMNDWNSCGELDFFYDARTSKWTECRTSPWGNSAGFEANSQVSIVGLSSRVETLAIAAMRYPFLHGFKKVDEENDQVRVDCQLRFEADLRYDPGGYEISMANRKFTIPPPDLPSMTALGGWTLEFEIDLGE